MPARPLPLDAPLQRTVPLHFQPSANAHTQGDPMDTSSGSPSMGPPYTHSNASAPVLGDAMSNGIAQPGGAAAAAQQPKVVQTAFIHKLYKSV